VTHHPAGGDMLVGQNKAVLANNKAAAAGGTLDFVIRMLFVLGCEPRYNVARDFEISGKRPLVAADVKGIALMEDRAAGLLVEQTPGEIDPHRRIAILLDDLAGRHADLLRELLGRS